MSKDHPFNLTFGELKLRYLDYNLKKKIKDEYEQNQTTYIQTDAFLDLSDKFTIDSDVQAIVLRSIQERIVAAGSFERLAHGEEEPKGYLVAKDRTYTFIPNTDAYIYKNITLRSKTTLS